MPVDNSKFNSGWLLRVHIDDAIFQVKLDDMEPHDSVLIPCRDSESVMELFKQFKREYPRAPFKARKVVEGAISGLRIWHT